MSRGGSSGGSSSSSRATSSGGGGGSSRSSGSSSRGYDSSPTYSGGSSSDRGGSSSYGGSRSSAPRSYEDGGSTRSSGRGESSAPIDDGADSVSVPRYTDAPRSSNLDSPDRVRFPAPYRSGTSAGRVPYSTGSGLSSTSPELVRLVDRYRGAANAGNSVSPIVDRYGRRGSDGSRVTVPGRGAPSLGLDSERYARGPRLRRSPSGSSVGRAADAAPAQRADRQGSRDGLARPSSGAGRSGGSRAGASGASGERTNAPAAEVRGAQGLTRLGARNPDAARRIRAAGGALADATSLGLGAAVGAVSGPAAGAAARGATRPAGSSKSEACFYGSSFCHSDWWFGFSFSFGCGWGGWWSGCWSPFWSCGWYPYYWYGYNYCYPYYSYPYYYYPYYYSTVVYDSYDDDGDVIVYADGEGDGYGEGAAQGEPVGEAAAAQRAPDSPVRTSLSIAAERYLTLGDSAFREGRFGDAAQFYAKAAEYAPEEGVLHLVLADALFATGDYHYAAYAIRRAFELDPTLAEAIVDKHEFYTDPADFDRHIARAELFLRDNPDDSDARLVLAANYLFGNRPASAVDLLESTSALSLRTDTAATTILAAARAVQHGVPAEKP